MILSRPQPVGILPIPAGLLILPPSPGQDGVDAGLLRQCVEGRSIEDLPESWSFYDFARQGDRYSALQALDGCEGEVADYNRFVLNPNAMSFEALRTTLKGDLGALLEIAAYNFGLVNHLPGAEDLNGELLAVALMAQAAAAMEKEFPEQAMLLLQKAVAAARVASPWFAAQLLGQLASICRTQGEPFRSHALTHYREAIALMGNARLPELLADLWMQLGMTCQEAAMGRDDRMTEAVRAYQEVLRCGLIPEEHAELFALAHNNLGLLYLSMRMSEGGDQLRMAIAVQSFREALRICNREETPELWASIQLNLANSLQYLPSSHPEENLVQAVELYEELVTVRKKAFDPVGYGRILSNQANALAHLGMFPPALEKLQEARKLFEWHNEAELAASAMDLVSQIHDQVGVSAARS